MAGRTGKVAVSITADPSGLEKGLRGAEGDLRRFGERGGRSLSGLKTAALGAGAAITTGLVYGLKESVDAAVEAEKSQARLQAQLKALGVSYRAHAREIDNVIQKTSQLAGLDDEDLQDAFTNIVRSTGSVNKGLKEMGLVADLARAKHMDVAKAGELVGKVLNGNTSVLKRYGIQLKDNATGAEAIAELHKKMSGQAEAYGKTAAGAQDRFRVAMENLKEEVGARVLPILTRLANKAADFVDQMRSGKGAGGEFVKTLKDIYERAKPIVEFFTKHPKYIAVAIGAWAAYKTAARLASIYAKAQLLSTFRGAALAQQVAAATAAGGQVGTAYGGKSGMGGKLMTAMRGLGWAALGYEIANMLGLDKAIKNQIDQALGNSPTFPDVAPTILPVAKGVDDGVNDAGDRSRQPPSSKSVQDSLGFRAHGSKPLKTSALSHASAFTNVMPGGPKGSEARTAAYNRGRDVGQAYDALYAAGFRGQALTNFLAIAGRESGWNTDAENLKGPDYSIGLWQINMKAHGTKYGTQAQLHDPYVNARAAYALSSGGRNMSPWKGQNGSWTDGISRSVWATARSASAGSHRSTPAVKVQGIMGLAQLVLKQFPGLVITSTTGGQHAPGSLHYSGLAVDIAGPQATMDKAAAWIKANFGSQLMEGIHNPNLSIEGGRTVPSSHWGAETWAQHRNHIHIAASKGTHTMAGTGGDSSGSSSAPAPPSPSEIVGNRLERIGLRETAGQLTHQQAQEKTLGVIQRALHGDFGKLGTNARLGLMGTRRGINQERRQAVNTWQGEIRTRNVKRVQWVYQAYLRKMAKVDEFENAGQIDSATAIAYRLAIIDQALTTSGFAAGHIPMSPHERRLVLADRQAVRASQESAADDYRTRRNEAMEGERVQAAENLRNFVGTGFDDAALTMAQIDTPDDTGDDLAILRGRQGIAQAEYQKAKSAGDRAGITEWGSTLTSLGQAIESLEAATKQNTEALLELQRTQTKQFQDLYNVSQTQYRALARGFADMVSGEIGGRAGILFQGPGVPGQLASY